MFGYIAKQTNKRCHILCNLPTTLPKFNSKHHKLMEDRDITILYPLQIRDSFQS